MERTIPFGREITLTVAWDEVLPPQIHPDHRTASGTLNITLSPAGGHFQGVREIVVETGALARFSTALAQLLDELSGSATLEPVMDIGDVGDFALTVTLKDGKGAVSGFVATQYHGARLTFEGIEIDQSYLAETQLHLRSLLARG